MSLLSLLAAAVMAGELILSPVADEGTFGDLMPKQPTVSFGALTGPLPTPTPTPVPAVLAAATVWRPTPAPTPVLPTYKAKKTHYTVALLGDSMIDTLGPDALHLTKRLIRMFPGTTFTILNYGVGGTNIDYGIERLTNPYTYLGNPMPSLLSQKPDIVVVESFGYNPYSYETGAIDRHWLALANIVNLIKVTLPDTKIVIAATIAPNSSIFGDGAAGLAFDDNGKRQLTTTIKKYLENTVRFAQSEKLPLADLYHASIDKKGEGILTYINAGDHIHYSDAGRELFAQKVTDTIISNHLLE